MIMVMAIVTGIIRLLGTELIGAFMAIFEMTSFTCHVNDATEHSGGLNSASAVFHRGFSSRIWL